MTQKIDTMLTKKHIYDLIYSTVDIVPEGDDSVFLGTFSIPDVPVLLHTIMGRVTRYYDYLLQSLPLTLAERLQLQVQRCFSYEEYQSIFNLSIKEQHFSHHAVFKTLLLTDNAQRLLFIHNQQEDESFEAYVACLQRWSKVHNPRVHSLVYETHY